LTRDFCRIGGDGSPSSHALNEGGGKTQKIGKKEGEQGVKRGWEKRQRAIGTREKKKKRAQNLTGVRGGKKSSIEKKTKGEERRLLVCGEGGEQSEVKRGTKSHLYWVQYGEAALEWKSRGEKEAQSPVGDSERGGEKGVQWGEETRETEGGCFRRGHERGGGGAGKTVWARG